LNISLSDNSIIDNKLAKLPILKLGDFGFAKALEYQSLASTLCGSPLYMAPEILKGEKYDAKSDLWSIGAIIFEMLTGRTPFRAQNHIELLRKIERSDGWIRFPDESADDHQFQVREYHGIIPRKIGHRKSYPHSISPQLGLHVGSLGSSPRYRISSQVSASSPIPEDLKTLIRALLKRNPVERMTFEEFFMNPTIVECRKLDQKANSMSQSQTIRLNSSPIETLTDTKPAEVPKQFSNMDLEVPFPEYNLDPKLVTKISNIHIPKVSDHINLNLEQRAPSTTHREPDQILEEPNSLLSFDSSLGSLEFSEELLGEEKKNMKNDQVSKVTNGIGDHSEEFVLIENKPAEINWHAYNPNQDDDQMPYNSADKEESTIQKEMPIPQNNDANSATNISSLDRALVLTPRGRLFGSLRGEPHPWQSNTSPAIDVPPQQLFGALPYVIDIEGLQGKERSSIVEIHMICCRAYSLYKLARATHEKDIPDFTSSSLAAECFEIYLFTLGLIQSGIETGKILWRSTRPENSSTYKHCLRIAVDFLNEKFNECLTYAETLAKGNFKSLQSTKGVPRIIYEAALTSSKVGAMNELRHQPCSNHYKSSILLLQALLHHEKDLHLHAGDVKTVNIFLKHLYNRLMICSKQI
jgi:serine/threonine-protein kinase ULK/ATG1